MVSSLEQVETRLPDGGAIALSGSTELELGARGALLLLEGAFRLDACPLGDTLRLTLRALGGTELRSESGGYAGPVIASEEQWGRLRDLHPRRFDMKVELAGEGPLRRASILIGAFSVPGQGSTRLTAQALVAEL